MSLRLYGVVLHEGNNGLGRLPTGVTLFPVRELAAVTEEGEYRAHDHEVPTIERHLEVINSVFSQDAVLPAPVGT